MSQGIWNRVIGRFPPPPGTPVMAQAALRQALLALDGTDVPLSVSAVTENDMTAEWNIVDARWRSLFEQSGMKRTARVLLRFHPQRHEVGAVLETGSVTWQRGLPVLSFSAGWFRGRMVEVSAGKVCALRGDGTVGDVAQYRFTTSELLAPLRDVVSRSGWTWQDKIFSP